jgi:hypothetical protein
MATPPAAPTKKASSPAALSATSRSGGIRDAVRPLPANANNLERLINFGQRQPVLLAKRVILSVTAGGLSIGGLTAAFNGIKSAFGHGGSEAVTHYVYEGRPQKPLSEMTGKIAASAQDLVTHVKGGKLEENLPFGFDPSEVSRDAQKYVATETIGNTTNGNSLVVPGATSSDRGKVVLQLGTKEECAKRTTDTPCALGQSFGDVKNLHRLDTAPNGDIQAVVTEAGAPNGVTNDPTKGVQHFNVTNFGTPRTVAKLIDGVPSYEKTTSNSVNYSATFDPNRPNLAFLRSTPFETPVSNGF